jgi:hypothetical protein
VGREVYLTGLESCSIMFFGIRSVEYPVSTITGRASLDHKHKILT